MVIDLIKEKKVNAIIDDIEGIVIIKDKNPINEILEKSNDIMKNNLKDLIKYSLSKNIKHKLSAKKFNHLDNVEKKMIGVGDDAHEISMDMLARMGMGLKFGGIMG